MLRSGATGQARISRLLMGVDLFRRILVLDVLVPLVIMRWIVWLLLILTGLSFRFGQTRECGQDLCEV